MQYGTFRIAKRYVPERETYRFGFPNGLFCKPFLPQKRRFRTVFRQKTGAFHCTSGLARLTTDTRPTGYALHTRGCDICGQAALRSVHAILGSANSAFFNIQPAAMPGGCQHRSAATPPAGAPWRLPPFVRRLHGQRRQAAAVGGGARLARRQRATQAADGQRKTDCHKPPRFCCKLVACRRLE